MGTGRFHDGPDEGLGSGECPTEEDVRGRAAEGGHSAGGNCKNVVRPSHLREMAKWAVGERSVPIRQACAAFLVSETCYRYSAMY